MSYVLEHRTPVLMATVVALFVVGAVDLLTGPLVSVSFLYLVPVAAATVTAGWRVGIAFSLLSGFISVGGVDFLGARDHGLATWNGVVMTLTLAFVVVLVDQATRRAKEALAAEARSREFLAMAAHQMRTPIAGIRSSAEALLMGDADAETSQWLLAGLAQQSQRAAHLLTGLLRMARLDQHEPVPVGPVDLVALARHAVDLVAALTPALRWDVTASGDTTIVATCNADAVLEALTNLLDNARRHAMTRVAVAVTAADGTTQVSVGDDGPGVPAGSEVQVFDRFVSLDGGGGTGLGLAISRGIAESHGGTLDWEAGRFVLRLPRDGQRTQSDRRSVSHAASERSAESSPRTSSAARSDAADVRDGSPA